MAILDIAEPDWRVIDFAPAYKVSSDGRVRRAGHDDLAPVKTKGYLNVKLPVNGRYRPFGIHRLMCLAFFGPPPVGKPLALHFNDQRDDNRLKNLRWGSQLDNMQDALRNGRRLFGEQCGPSKLSPEQVRAIRKDRRPETVVAKDYPCTSTNIGQVRRGTTWGHLT